MDKDLNPLVSVILPVYNGERYLRDSIESVLNQPYNNFELIIIEDGSTDQTNEIILSFSDPRIIPINNDRNRGLIYSLNKGLELANGKYIARMDADDMSFPDRFKKQVSFMEANPKIGICGTAVKVNINGETKILYYPESDLDIRIQMLDRPPFSHPTIMIRKSILDKYNIFYSNDFVHNEDFRLYVDLLQVTKASNLKTPLLYYNTINPNRISNQNQSVMKKLRSENRKLFAQYYFNITKDEAKVMFGEPGNTRVKSYLNLKNRVTKKEKKILSQTWYTDTLNLVKNNFLFTIKYLYILFFDFSFINIKRWFYLFSHIVKNENQ